MKNKSRGIEVVEGGLSKCASEKQKEIAKERRGALVKKKK